MTSTKGFGLILIGIIVGYFLSDIFTSKTTITTILFFIKSNQLTNHSLQTKMCKLTKPINSSDGFVHGMTQSADEIQCRRKMVKVM